MNAACGPNGGVLDLKCSSRQNSRQSLRATRNDGPFSSDARKRHEATYLDSSRLQVLQHIQFENQRLRGSVPDLPAINDSNRQQTQRNLHALLYPGRLSGTRCYVF